MPVRSSCFPWAAEARRNALARSFAEAKVVAVETMRPPPKQIGLVRASVHAGGAVEHLANLGAAAEQFCASRLPRRARV